MSETTVIHVREYDPSRGDVYIGRAVPRRGLAGSIFGNPFRIGRDGTRQEVIERYRAHVLTIIGLHAFLREIRGKRLACWCAPETCHGDVLAELADAGAGQEEGAGAPDQDGRAQN